MSSTDGQRRAISTVVDVAVALVLISGAIGVLAVVPSEKSEPVSDRSYTVETLSATTVNFTYSVDSEIATVDTDHLVDSEHEQRDTTYAFEGSLARGLAVAAITNSTTAKRHSDNSRRKPNNHSFVRALESALAETQLLDSSQRQVHAVWKPFDGANISGTVSFGPAPPSDVDTTISHLTVPSGFYNGTGQLTAVTGTPTTDTSANTSVSFDQLSRSLATAAVDGLLKPQQTQRQLDSQHTDRERAAVRLQHVINLITGIEITDSEIEKRLDTHSIISVQSSGLDGQPLTEYFVDTLSEQFKTELTREFSTPTAAKQAVSIDEVRIAVTEWDR